MNTLRRYALYFLLIGLCAHTAVQAADASLRPSFSRRIGRFLNRHSGTLAVLAALAALSGGYWYDQQNREEAQEGRFDDVKQEVRGGVERLSTGQEEIKKSHNTAREAVMQQIVAAEQDRREKHDMLTALVNKGFTGMGTKIDVVGTRVDGVGKKIDGVSDTVSGFEDGLLERHNTVMSELRNAAALQQAADRRAQEIQQAVERSAEDISSARGTVDMLNESTKRQLQHAHSQALAAQQNLLMESQHAVDPRQKMAADQALDNVAKHLDYLQQQAKYFPGAELSRVEMVDEFPEDA